MREMDEAAGRVPGMHRGWIETPGKIAGNGEIGDARGEDMAFSRSNGMGKNENRHYHPPEEYMRYLSRLPCLFVRVFCLEKCGDIGAKRDKPAGENCL